jgi:hypothetical protein
VAERDAHGPDGLNPAAVALALRANRDNDATVAVDMGANFIHMPRHFRTYHPRHLLFSNGQQTLGLAMPWAIAATLARPGKQVESVSGDGGFLFAAIERGRVRVPTLQKALTEDGVSILDVTVDYSRSVDLAATLVEDRSYEHRPGSAVP